MSSLHDNTIGNKLLSESKFYSGYSRWNEETGARETWDEAVERVMQMHKEKYASKLTPQLLDLMEEAEQAYKEKLVLGAQRALQFGGDQLRKHEMRAYNCSSSHCDRPEFFNEAMYILLCGCGVGFSVQKRHVSKLPTIVKRSEKKVKVHRISDDIEGWANAYAVLLSSYFRNGEGVFPEYNGYQVHFDFSLIRPKGSFISGGFKAPGPDGLRASLLKCEELLEKHLKTNDKISPIVAYDFVMHMADAVLSGGVRRSATICLFDKDDQEMLNAKTGNWFIDNPQRGRSNNSVIIKRDELTRKEFAAIMKSVKEFGEPGFVFVDNLDVTVNPCVEIGMLPKTADGRTGWQLCNLTETNGAKCVDKETFFRACRASAILGTLQAGYTNFKYVSSSTKEITDREALLGVSVTGWMNSPAVLFDEDTLHKGAEIVKEVNALVAEMIGVNPAARTTCVKPAGNTSTILGTASGIHGEHSRMHFRNVQMNAMDEVAEVIKMINPEMVEPSLWSTNKTDIVVAFPVVVPAESIYKKDLLGTNQLNYVKHVQKHWVEPGTRVELCTDPTLRHNVSNTITVDNWDEVEQYIFDNRQWFAGISLLGMSGDKDYVQAPFTEVLTAKQIVNKYGDCAMLASGLIVDALSAFNNNLWEACTAALTGSVKSEEVLKADWIRRFKKFSANHLKSNDRYTTELLKDVYNLHKWLKITSTIQDIDFHSVLGTQSEVDVDTLGSQACAGGQCEINF